MTTDATPSTLAKENKIRPYGPLRIVAVICAHNPPLIWRDIFGTLCRFSFSEVVVVDDGSHPPVDLPSTTERAAAVRILRSSVNAGLAAARNYALENIEADWVLFVDADVMPSEAFLASLPRRLHETAADGLGFHVREHYQRSDWDFFRACERNSVSVHGPVEWVSGLLCAYRAESLRVVGGFDPSFRSNGEDVDLGYRLTRAEKRLVQVPEVCGEHYRKDTLWSFVRMHQRYALTAKRVDRSLYFPDESSLTRPPLFRWESVWPLGRLIFQFLRYRPYAFYLPIMVLGAMLAGAHAGRRLCRVKRLDRQGTNPAVTTTQQPCR
jgi:GT2 family glycosyltransferase